MIVEILHNISELSLAAVGIYFVLSLKRLGRGEKLRSFLLSVVLGLIAYLVTTNPLMLGSGATIDARAGPIVLAGFVGGLPGALVAATLGAVARWQIGGSFAVSALVVFYLYGLAGWGVRTFQGRQGMPKPELRDDAILIVLASLCAFSAYFLISPRGVANTWLAEVLPFILIANAVSIILTSYVVRAVMLTVEERDETRVLKERMQLATASAELGVFEADLASGHAIWDARQHEIYGLPESSFDGKKDTWLSSVVEADRARVRKLVSTALTDKASYEVSFDIEIPTGEIRNLTQNGLIIRDRYGKPKRVVGMTRDLTEDKAKEQAEQNMRKQFEALAENLPGAVLQHSRMGNGDERIEFMNAGGARLFGLAEPQIPGPARQIWDLGVHAAPKVIAASMQTSVAEMEPWSARWSIRTPDGVKKTLLGHGKPSLEPDGRVLWNTLVLDVTEQARLESELAESRALFERAQRLEGIGKLTGGVAHDFNNLLAVILGNLELIRDETHGEQLLGSIDDAINAALRGSDLTSKMLNFARMAKLEPVVFDLNEILADTDTWLGRTIPANINLNKSFADDLWKVEADRTSTVSAVLNLVINARDAMPGGGALTLETRNVEVGPEYIETQTQDVTCGNYVMLAVSDNGEGIAPELMDKIFDPFFTTKDVGKGTGLGLSMVDGFIRQSGGFIRVYSEPGKGTSFKLFFPSRTSVAVSEQLPQSRPGIAFSGRSILVVEDQPEVLRVIALALERAGYDIQTAASGDEALGLFGRLGNVDLVVTDVVMPGTLQGPALVKAIREIDPDMPAIFMSGYASEATMYGNGLRPEDTRLMKPVLAADLVTEVEASLANVTRRVASEDQNPSRIAG